ncbi:phage tail tape measure protein [Kosakonia quasisacchari]|uniref:Phage tail tape measure protein n=1 Tax=Kosakonia quasisacchari TaxID=2529380 RepID=A0A4R0GQ74_9ENTR|nr:phage tail tape measure protein [Kosakonia quasisacchari]TCB97751.1 phage tail tape measure protein [Kosakonia quasisacchari]
MSNSVNIEALLAAVDQAKRPFQSLQTANVSLADGIKETEKNLRGLYSQAAQIDGFTRTQSALNGVSQQLKIAKASTQALAFELKKIDKPSEAQITALDKARANVSALKQQHDSLRQSVKNQRQTLQQAGISTRAPATAKQRLQQNISSATEQLSSQQQALKQENRQQRLVKIKESQQSILGVAGKVSAVGKTGMSIATTGINLGKKLLQPGYEASLQTHSAVPPATPGSAVASLQTRTAAPGTAAASQQQRAGSLAPAVAARNNSTSAPAPAAAMQNNAGNLGTDLEALQAAYQSLSVDIFATQESSLRMLVQTATGYLGQLQQWVQNNQGLVQSFGLIATVIVGIAGAIGTVASVIAPVFTGISTLITIATTFGSVFTTVCGGIMAVIGGLTWPIVAVVAAIAAGAALIYKYREPISAFFSGVIEGIVAAFAPIAEMFAPLQPVFDAIGSALQTVKDTFSELLTPIKASEETLTQFGDVGQTVGKALVNAFTWPLNLFRSLSESAMGLLETLGIIDKKPALALKPSIEQPATGGVSSYIQPTSSQPGYNAYQMARPSTGSSYLDQSRTEYNVTLQGDVTPGSNNERYLQDLFRQDADNRRNNALSQFNP